MRFRLFFFLSALLFFWVSPRRVLAGELGYEAPADCPRQDAVAARVARRVAKSRDATLTIRKVGGRFAAHVSIGAGNDTVERDVEGRTCDAVIDAFVLLMSLDRASPDDDPIAEPA